MRHKARRLPVCGWQGAVRRVLPAARALLAVSRSGAIKRSITSARYSEPASRYVRSGLEIGTTGFASSELAWSEVCHKTTHTIRPPLSSVFENVAPRLADVDSDAEPEIIVVETSVTTSATQPHYDMKGKRATTPYTDMQNRWLASITRADWAHLMAVTLPPCDIGPRKDRVGFARASA